MELFYEMFQDLPRGGPGSNECTKKAFQMLSALPENPRVLDIGCGPGMQTLELARVCKCNIIGLDNHQPFLDKLEANAIKLNLANRIQIVNGDMFNLDFEHASFDVIWSEGAIYIVGFENGLKSWCDLLKPGGYIAVSELSWLRANPPAEPVKFFKSEYPDMRSIEENLTIIKDCGYLLIGHFTLPERAWWDDYYTPLEARIQILRKNHATNPEAQAMYDDTETEIEMYRKFSKWYGYEFYIIQK